MHQHEAIKVRTTNYTTPLDRSNPAILKHENTSHNQKTGGRRSPTQYLTPAPQPHLVTLCSLFPILCPTSCKATCTTKPTHPVAAPQAPKPITNINYADTTPKAPQSGTQPRLRAKQEELSKQMRAPQANMPTGHVSARTLDTPPDTANPRTPKHRSQGVAA